MASIHEAATSPRTGMAKAELKPTIGADGEFKRVLASWTDELLAPAGRIESLIGHRHQPTKGAHREVLVRNFLRRMVPGHLTVSTGFVYYWERGASRQQDIIVWDSTAASPLLEDGELVVVTGDAVRAVVEVKSRWRDASTNAFAGLHSVQDSSTPATELHQMSRGLGITPFRGLVVFERVSGDRMFGALRRFYRGRLAGTDHRWTEAVTRATASAPTNMLDAICSVEGSILWQHPGRFREFVSASVISDSNHVSVSAGLFAYRLSAFLRKGATAEPELAAFKSMARVWKEHRLESPEPRMPATKSE